MTRRVERDAHASDYARWFESLTSNAPRDWQTALAGEATPRSRLVRIPTGYGKTLGVLGAWLYRRVHLGDPRWPRRLVWTLPMRVLVEQTLQIVSDAVAKLDRSWPPGAPHDGKVGVHPLMGGADAGGDWNLHPEADAVFIGTQDMLLSRALNRGYAAGRARWPMEFGLLNHDALWVLDEVQLMDVGLATTAQLQSFFEDDAKDEERPRISWWMSATLQPPWLRSVDTTHRHDGWADGILTLPPSARRHGPAAVSKKLSVVSVPLADHGAFATRCGEAHAAAEDGDFGRITLVVCNTVERAVRIHEILTKLKAAHEIELVHGRFRPAERAAWRPRFLDRAVCRQGVDRIIVATQVVEAGVDVSATALVTELAPWSSLVQRFGRCARYGGRGLVIVADRGHDDEASALPYTPELLAGASWALQRIRKGPDDVGISCIEEFEEGLTEAERQRLYPYEPAHLLIRRDLDELFDTTPDLTGADVDISRFIRTGEERDLSVFWLDVPAVTRTERWPKPPPGYRPSRAELCAVPFLRAREWLCGKAKLAKRAWLWDWLEGEWVRAEQRRIVPGAIVCVAADFGGYLPDRGFDPGSSERVEPVPPVVLPDPQAADEADDSEQLSAAAYKTIATHDREVGTLAEEIARELGVTARLVEVLGLAGRWHDYGKSHPAFQAIIEDRGEHSGRVDLAKAPDGAWQRPCRYRRADGETRPGFRHELASCLALFAVLQRYQPGHPALLGPWADVLALTGDPLPPTPVADPATATHLERAVLECTADEFDLLAYLVLSHHGKVRVSMSAGPKDQDYRPKDERGLPIRGVREGDELPGVTLDGGAPVSALSLTLSPAGLGLSTTTGRSWRDRTLSLQAGYGPARLAWLEALLMAADRRASRFDTADPLLTGAGE